MARTNSFHLLVVPNWYDACLPFSRTTVAWGVCVRESVVRNQLVRFLQDEEGLVTLEWVALAAAVIVLAIGVIVVIQSNLNTAASTIGSKIVSTVNSNS